MSRSTVNLTLAASTALTRQQATNERLILCDTALLALTMTLPPNPEDGLEVVLKREGANLLTINPAALPAGTTIEGGLTALLEDDNAVIHLQYDAASNDWKIINPDLGANLDVATFIGDAALTAEQSSRGAVNLANTAAGAITLDLPAAPNTGDHCYFKNIGAAANALTVDGNGNTIDGAATLAITDGLAAHLVFDGTQWRRISELD